MPELTVPEPGIYYEVEADEYFAWAAVNNSSLSYAARSMAHYRFAPPIKQSVEMRFGSLIHCGKLEPAAIGMRYAVMPDFASEIRKPDGTEYSNVRATKQYKEAVAAWEATIGDRESCTSADLTRMLEMVQALTHHDFARATLAGPGPTEVCFVWDDPDSGVRCKCRVDKWDDMTGGMAIYDLKTTRDASDFERSIAKFAYHRQAAFYSDGVALCSGSPVAFGIIAVEKEPPYGVRGAMVSEDAVDQGRREYKRLLAALADARRTNVWPGYDDPEYWQLPGWYAQDEDEELGITINGEIVA